MGMGKIAVGIVGVGNCASSLVQGLEFYRVSSQESTRVPVGLMHDDLCGYRPSDIEVVCAFDVDARKVDQPLDAAILAPPNNTRTLYRRLPRSNVLVQMGPVLDGVAAHMGEYPPDQAFSIAARKPADVVGVLRRSGAAARLPRSSMLAPASKPASGSSTAFRSSSPPTRSGPRSSSGGASRSSGTTSSRSSAPPYCTASSRGCSSLGERRSTAPTS